MASNPVGFEITNSTAGWNGSDFDEVFIRKDCFLEGGLWGWGFNQQGIMGTNNVTPRSSPVQTISGGTNWKSLSAKGLFTASAIKTDGTLWLMGYNTNGFIGDNTRTNRSSPVQTVSGGTNWKCATAGTLYTAAIKNDGTLWTWGANSNGGLGDNTRVNRSSPVQTISSGTNWKSVSSYTNTIGIKTDGTLWIWGTNIGGTLGNQASSASVSSPVQTISTGTNWKQATTGWFVNGAVKTDGSLWLWGNGSAGGAPGALGNNLRSTVSSPVQTVSNVTTWKQVSAGCIHMAAIKTDGSLWLWGTGTRGILGTNNTINRSSPVQTVSAGTNWRVVDIAYAHAAAIKTDGTLWTWGYNSNSGRLGDNTLIDRSSPVQTVSGGTSWRSIHINSSSTMATREDCW
jgi:alpha-tubulin suppressor-like RCC1 family protein